MRCDDNYNEIFSNFSKDSLKKDDCLKIWCNIRHKYQLVIYESSESFANDKELISIMTDEGGSLCNVWSIKENLKYQGTMEEIIEKYPEFFL